MACADVETLSVMSTFANLRNNYRKEKYNVAHETNSPCSWTVWPTASERFNIKFWSVEAVVLGCLQRQNVNVTKGN